LKPELVDPVDWNQIVEQIDIDFGDGTTRKLLGNHVPVSMERGKKKSFYLIPARWTSLLEKDFDTFDIMSMGIWFGEIAKGRIRLGISIINNLSQITDSIIIVSERAAQSFTYGRSILRESLLEIPPNLVRGQRVVVMDRQDRCLGLAVLSVDANKVSRLAKDRLVAKNIVDIGWYIRRLG